MRLKEVIILCLDKPTSENLNFAKLAQFMGVNCNVVCLKVSNDYLNDIRKHLKLTASCVVINCETLASILRQTNNVDELKYILESDQKRYMAFIINVPFKTIVNFIHV